MYAVVQKSQDDNDKNVVKVKSITLFKNFVFNDFKLYKNKTFSHSEIKDVFTVKRIPSIFIIMKHYKPQLINFQKSLSRSWWLFRLCVN